MSGDGLRDELTDAFRASDLAGGGIDYPTLVAAVLPVVQARIDAAVARAEAAEQAVQQVRAKTAEQIAECIEAEYVDSPWIRTAIDIARRHAKEDIDG